MTKVIRAKENFKFQSTLSGLEPLYKFMVYIVGNFAVISDMTAI